MSFVSVPDGVATLLLTAAGIGARVARGETPEAGEVARALVDVALELLPTEELRRHLDEAAAARVERLADAAERIKFGRSSDGG